MIDRDDYAVRLLDLPTDVGGFITESPDGFLNIYINARHASDKRLQSLRHELRHADGDDLHSTEPVAVIEARTDSTPPLPPLIRASDLLPQPLPQPPSPPPSPPLTANQVRALAYCLSDLDRCFFTSELYY